MGYIYNFKKIWYINIVINGRRIRKSIGRNKALAMNILKALERIDEVERARSFLKSLMIKGLLTEYQKKALNHYIDKDYKDFTEGESIQMILIYKEMKRSNVECQTSDGRVIKEKYQT